MQLLEHIHLVQYFLFEAKTLQLDPTSAIIAPNGAGKSALLDALQMVLLGGDRRHIHFNAQAGGKARARSIRDYCLGVFRAGEDGRKRRTATTYISLVFRDQDTGVPLTAGISLGASADEPEHRQHGLYLLPGVDLPLEEHLEKVKGKELPLEWGRFREHVAKRCRQAGTAPEFHASGERFVKDLLHRLRANPGGSVDYNAYRKAFQNALNLQRVEDVDLFVRTLVAEDRPTDIARFKALLDSFRQIKERIEQLERRIAEAEAVDAQYEKVAAQAVRAASYRALAAEYGRDLLGEQVEQAGADCEAAQAHLTATGLSLEQARSERRSLQEEYERLREQLQGSKGYGEQASLRELSARDREQLARLKSELLRQLDQLRAPLQEVVALGLPGVDIAHLAQTRTALDQLHGQIAALAPDAELALAADAVHAQLSQAMQATAPAQASVGAWARHSHEAWQLARARRDAAKGNQQRMDAGQAGLRDEVMRLLNYLREAGIEAQPVCDLVRVSDKRWQPAIEAYLRSHVEALLVPAGREEDAVRVYRSLQGARAVYGVKLALPSQARGGRAERPAEDAVAALIEGDNADAVAYLRRQLGELRCVETEAEVVRSRQGLTRDGLVAKGGGIERRRLPASGDLKIGVAHDGERARLLRAELDSAERALRECEPEARRAEALRQKMARLDGHDAARIVHDHLLEHHQVQARYRALERSLADAMDPDLLRLGERSATVKSGLETSEARIESLVRAEALAQGDLERRQALLAALQAQEEIVARNAVEAFRDPHVDPNRVERLREELEEKGVSLEEARNLCERRAQDNDRQLSSLLPEAWSQLQRYAGSHGLDLEFAADAWKPARALMQAELHQLRETELVNYRAEAERAYETAVETFRSNVANTLHDNFVRLKSQIDALNRTLRNSPAFSNNERYRFNYEVVAEFKDLHRFIQRVADLGAEDGLFGSAGEVPEAFRMLLEDASGARLANSPLDDYRRFFHFGVEIRQDERLVGTLSERMRSGSGGEHRAPLYVIAGAALAAAYGKSEAHSGGIGVILLDEFGDKIDAQNARATTNYLRSLGLQLVLAAPDTAQGTLSGVLDSYIELFRDGDLLQAERIEVKQAARELLLSDQFDLHPELLAEELERLARETGTA
jgi:chromosome segregation protein